MSNSAVVQELTKKLKKLKIAYYVGWSLLILGAAPYFLTPTSARSNMDFATIALYISLLIPGGIVMTYIKLALGKLDIDESFTEAARIAGAERLLKTFMVSQSQNPGPAKMPGPKPAGPHKVKPETQEHQPSAILTSLNAGSKAGARTRRTPRG